MTDYERKQAAKAVGKLTSYYLVEAKAVATAELGQDAGASPDIVARVAALMISLAQNPPKE